MIKKYITVVKTKLLDFLYPDLRYTTLNIDIKRKRKRKRVLFKYSNITKNDKAYLLYSKINTKLHKHLVLNEIVFTTNNLTFLN